MSDPKRKNHEIESFNLMDLDVSELERRLELAPLQQQIASSATVGCDRWGKLVGGGDDKNC